MIFFRSTPLIVLSALLVNSTALASCPNCSTNTSATKRNIFSGVTPRITRTQIFSNSSDSTNTRIGAYGPIFGTNDCTRKKCGGAIFGPQTCKKVKLPCDSCKKTKTATPNKKAFIKNYVQNYKTIPSDDIYNKIHKCKDLAPFQLEWVDFRLQDGDSDSFSRKLGNYRFRLFGCRRFSKNAILNEGRIIQKNMQFIDIFEQLVNDCYNIVKVPNDVCLQNQDYEAPEYILTAEITDYFMNVCDGYDWDNAKKEDKRTGSAEMTVTWRLMDLTKSKVLWKGQTTGYSELHDGEYNGEISLIEMAFADASSNLKGLPEFEQQLSVRVSPETLAQQKTELLALEQAADPIKCKVPAKTADICPIAEESLTTSEEIITEPEEQYTQQCSVPAEILEYTPQENLHLTNDSDFIPLELEKNNTAPYSTTGGSICYGYNNASNNYDFDAQSINTETYAPTTPYVPTTCASSLDSYMTTDVTPCENPLFGNLDQPCDPTLLSFIQTDQNCLENDLVKWINTPENKNPQICLFEANEVSSSGGISKDSGYFVPEIEVVSPADEIKQTADWQPYTQPTEMHNADDIPDEGVISVATGIADSGIIEPPIPVEVKEEPQIIELGNYRSAEHFCIENIAPYPDMRPENLYKVRTSMMSVRNQQGVESAGLLIAEDLILTSADLVDNQNSTYEIETINGVKETAKVIRVNIKKNIALLKTNHEMYFRPLSLNMELPPVGQNGFMSLGLLNNAEGENYLDDKGSIKGYRFSDGMGTEIITDTFVQTVSSGGLLIDEKGVVTGMASRNKKFDDNGDLFTPIQDAINSVGLEVCGQAEPFIQAPLAVVKPISSAIDNFTGSKAPEVMYQSKRK